MSLRDYLAASAEVLDRAAIAIPPQSIEAAIDCIVAALSSGRPLLVCGNGGSAADAMHIAGELVARFLRDRRALRVVCLSENPAVLTAWSNDCSFDTVFARQVAAYGGEGAVLLGLSTSGTSRNVVAPFEQARRMGAAHPTGPPLPVPLPRGARRAAIGGPMTAPLSDWARRTRGCAAYPVPECGPRS